MCIQYLLECASGWLHVHKQLRFKKTALLVGLRDCISHEFWEQEFRPNLGFWGARKQEVQDNSCSKNSPLWICLFAYISDELPLLGKKVLKES